MSETHIFANPPTSEFEALVREHQVGLRAFIRALGIEEVWVDDVAQDAFVVAYRRLEDFEEGTDFGKWLRSIARHLVANERRKEARRSRLLPLAVADVLLAHEENNESVSLDLCHWLSAMQDCVSQLPPRSQELLRRRYAAGENASSLARELRLNADAVRQTLLRVRLAVKECIQKKTGGAWL
jgi:RNA polymerase sigma-70 factor (ECF subfamily)